VLETEITSVTTAFPNLIVAKSAALAKLLGKPVPVRVIEIPP
jgi:hypothetical protein